MAEEIAGAVTESFETLAGGWTQTGTTTTGWLAQMATASKALWGFYWLLWAIIVASIAVGLVAHQFKHVPWQQVLALVAVAFVFFGVIGWRAYAQVVNGLIVPLLIYATFSVAILALTKDLTGIYSSVAIVASIVIMAEVFGMVYADPQNLFAGFGYLRIDWAALGIKFEGWGILGS